MNSKQCIISASALHPDSLDFLASLVRIPYTHAFERKGSERTGSLVWFSRRRLSFNSPFTLSLKIKLLSLILVLNAEHEWSSPSLCKKNVWDLIVRFICWGISLWVELISSSSSSQRDEDTSYSLRRQAWMTAACKEKPQDFLFFQTKKTPSFFILSERYFSFKLQSRERQDKRDKKFL